MTVQPETFARLASGHLVWVQEADEDVARVLFVERFRTAPETVPAADLAPTGPAPVARRPAAGPQVVVQGAPIPAH